MSSVARRVDFTVESPAPATPTTAPRVVVNVDAEAAAEALTTVKADQRWVLQCATLVEAPGSSPTLLQGMRKVVCKGFKNVNGVMVECNKQMSCRFLHVLVNHLNTHGINSTNYAKRLGEANQPTIRESMAKAAPMLNHEELVLTMMATEGIAGRLLDSPLYRQVTNSAMNRRAFHEMLAQLRAKLYSAAVKSFPRATLALDIGTHKRRYVAFVLVARGRALFHSMTDVEAVGGSFTSSALRAVVDATLQALRADGVTVTGIVADNASNVQGICNVQDVPEASLEVDNTDPVNFDNSPDTFKALPGMIRCACHVLQLMVKDLGEYWTEEFEIAKGIAAVKKLSVSACETRWNSKYNVIVAAVPFAQGDDKVLLDDAILLLEPFAIATDVLQSDAATVFTAMAVYESLEAHFTRRHVATPAAFGRRKAAFKEAAATVLRRVKTMATPGVLVLSYFCPSTNMDSTNAMLVAPQVMAALRALAPDSVAEIERLERCQVVIDPTEPGTKLGDYKHRIAHIESLGLPRIAAVLRDLIDSTASEASVERLFSRLVFTFNKWRVARASAGLVETTLQVVSAYQHFFPPETQEERDAQAERQRARKSARAECVLAEAAANPTDAINNPDPFTADQRRIALLATLEQQTENQFTAGQTVDGFCDAVLSHFADRERVLPPEARGARMSTRQQTDRCIECNKPCQQHEIPVHYECSCGRRKSVWHTERMRAFYKDEPWRNIGSAWKCPMCERAVQRPAAQ